MNEISCVYLDLFEFKMRLAHGLCTEFRVKLRNDRIGRDTLALKGRRQERPSKLCSDAGPGLCTV